MGFAAISSRCGKLFASTRHRKQWKSRPRGDAALVRTTYPSFQPCRVITASSKSFHSQKELIHCPTQHSPLVSPLSVAFQDNARVSGCWHSKFTPCRPFYAGRHYCFWACYGACWGRQMQSNLSLKRVAIRHQVGRYITLLFCCHHC